MPSLYVGGYFSQLVISAIYPFIVEDSAVNLRAGVVGTIGTHEIPIDVYASFTAGAITGVEIVTVLAATSYANTEVSHTLTDGSVSAVNLVVTIVFKTLSNEEVSQKLSGGSISSINLTVTIVYVTYSNTETSNKLSAGSITAINLV